MYTSSEDDKEPPRRRAEDAHREEAYQDRATKGAGATAGGRKDEPVVEHIPDNPEVLKKVYRRRHDVWKALHARHQALVEEINEMLRESTDEVYLAEGDPGLPTPEEMAKLRREMDHEWRYLKLIGEKLGWHGKDGVFAIGEVASE